jgi:hypothetical protein
VILPGSLQLHAERNDGSTAKQRYRIPELAMPVLFSRQANRSAPAWVKRR